uniref:Plasma membrane-associated cation-binding protein 1 n=1 Tax=Oryza glumipatula TaxID=40148 RepID=A0A0D9YQJ4_9ORYZ
MDYWKTKVLPKIKVVFAKGGNAKKAAAAELIKSFDESKEGINGEFEEKKADLQPKVVEIYEAAPAPLKVLIKDRAKVSGIKKNSAAVTKFVDDLAKIEFPGAKQLSEGIAKVGPALLSGPVFATFEKVSTLLPADEEEIKPKEAPAAAAEEEKKEEAAAAGEEKKEEAEEKKEEEAAAPADEPAAAAGESAPAAAEAEPPVEAAATPAAAEAAPAKAEEEEAPKA